MAVESDTQIDRNINTTPTINSEHAMLARDIHFIHGVDPDSVFLPPRVEQLSSEVVSEAITTGELQLPYANHRMIEELSGEVAGKVLEVLEQEKPARSELEVAQAQKIALLTSRIEAMETAYAAEKRDMDTLYPEAAAILRAHAELQARLDDAEARIALDDTVINIQRELLQEYQGIDTKAVLATKAIETVQLPVTRQLRKQPTWSLRRLAALMPSAK